MKLRSQICGTLITLGLLVGNTAHVAAAENSNHERDRLQAIEQPLALKIGVTLGGIGLIGGELWWFIFSKTKAKKAESNDGLQEVAIKVDGGYEPDRIVVQAGQPVQLKFLRQDPSSCLEKVLLPDFHIAAELPLNQETVVEFVPEKPGEYQFTCGMNMFRGVVKVQS